MRSSIFNSKHPAILWTKRLVFLCAALAVFLEVATAYLLKRYSETYARVSRQYADALSARPSKPGEPTSVLMVGNSLLLYGIDVDRLRALTSGQLHIYPIFLEATGYYDWLYGLQGLFQRGARPQVVVLGVGMNELFSNAVRRDYAPMMFLNDRDVFKVASDLKMDRTDTADLFLAHASTFWDMRGVLRIQVLRRTIPHCRELFMLLQAPPHIPPQADFDAIAATRLRRLQALCQANGAKLMILVPPAPSSADAVRRLTMVSSRVGVDTLVPLDPQALSTKYYLADEIHLNPEGAELFTSALAFYLPRIAKLRSGADLITPE
jgi:lysophospholipase L1-like esterase